MTGRTLLVAAFLAAVAAWSFHGWWSSQRVLAPRRRHGVCAAG